jgi:hypothetical protein
MLPGSVSWGIDTQVSTQWEAGWPPPDVRTASGVATTAAASVAVATLLMIDQVRFTGRLPPP